MKPSKRGLSTCLPLFASWTCDHWHVYFTFFRIVLLLAVAKEVCYNEVLLLARSDIFFAIFFADLFVYILRDYVFVLLFDKEYHARSLYLPLFLFCFRRMHSLPNTHQLLGFKPFAITFNNFKYARGYIFWGHILPQRLWRLAHFGYICHFEQKQETITKGNVILTYINTKYTIVKVFGTCRLVTPRSTFSKHVDWLDNLKTCISQKQSVVTVS